MGMDKEIKEAGKKIGKFVFASERSIAKIFENFSKRKLLMDELNRCSKFVSKIHRFT